MRRPPRLLPFLGLSAALAAAVALGDQVSEAMGHPLAAITAAATDAADELRGAPEGRATAAVRGVRGAAPALAGRRSLADVAPAGVTYDGEADGGGWVARDAAEAELLLELETPGTYMSELLTRTDSSLTRWPSRPGRPLQYWVQSGAELDGWSPMHVRQVRDAFAAWEETGIPVHFAATADSARADILVVWTPQFTESISGKTRWIHDRRGWIRSAQVTLALRRSTGEVLEPDAVHAIALHEIGHALGMDHTDDAANVMAPKVRVRQLSEADRATVQLLYRLPPGSLRK